MAYDSTVPITYWSPSMSKAAEPTVTKTEAVRQALQHNPKFSPAEGVAWIKEQFDIDLSPTHWSTYRFNQNKKAGTSTIVRSRSTATAPAAHSPSSNGTAPSTLQLAKSLMVLVRQYGVTEVASTLEIVAALSE